MIYNPKLVEYLLGEEIAKLFDGTITIESSDNLEVFGNLIVGDKLTFKFKGPTLPLRQFIVTGNK